LKWKTTARISQRSHPDPMPVNGLMVTLSADPERASQALGMIDGHDGLELGERHDRWLAVVAETRDDHEARALHQWLEGLPGVDQVGVILVAFDDESQP
jgi:hypothetical protein